MTNSSDICEDLSAQIDANHSEWMSRIDSFIPSWEAELKTPDLVLDPHPAERQKILNWLSKRNFWGDQGYYFDLAENKTGQWLLDSLEFQNWIDGRKRFLWCCGNRIFLSPRILANSG